MMAAAGTRWTADRASNVCPHSSLSLLTHVARISTTGGVAPLTSSRLTSDALAAGVKHSEARCASLSKEAVAQAEASLDAALADPLPLWGDGAGEKEAAVPRDFLFPSSASFNPHRRLAELLRPDLRWEHLVVSCNEYATAANAAEAAYADAEGVPSKRSARSIRQVQAPARLALAAARARALRSCAEDAERDAAKRSLPLVSAAASALSRGPCGGVARDGGGGSEGALHAATAADAKERGRAVYEAACCVRRWGELTAQRLDAQRRETEANEALERERERAEGVRQVLVARAGTAAAAAAGGAAAGAR